MILGADGAYFGATHTPSRHIIAEWFSAPMSVRGLTRGKLQHHDATRYERLFWNYRMRASLLSMRRIMVS